MEETRADSIDVLEENRRGTSAPAREARITGQEGSQMWAEAAQSKDPFVLPYGKLLQMVC